MRSLQPLFDNNRHWAREIQRQDPEFFGKLSRQQAPRHLWIGCSDSRVPANEIVGLLPGELFVHRNVANVVVHTDLNCLSVLQFAVDVLHVEHIIVCGHYRCGGVRATLLGERLGLIDNWLRHVGDVRDKHEAHLLACPEGEPRWARLCELNVVEQVINVAETTVVRDAWSRGQEVTLHGWIYGVHDGLLQDLGMTSDGPGQATAAAREALARMRGGR